MQVIGLTGHLGSGKTEATKILSEEGYISIALSDILKEELKNKNISITRDNLIKLGNKLREKHGEDILALKAIEKLKKMNSDKIIIDGIRNPDEVKTLRNNLNKFLLISVEVPRNVRLERVKFRGKASDPKTITGLKKIDAADSDIGIADCISMSNAKLENSGDINEFRANIKSLILSRKRPTWDEYFTNICDSVAERATCDRGKSGSIIVKDKRIISTGYVGSPIGMPHCDESGHLMRDVIDENGDTSKHCVRTIHAEQNALIQAAKYGISTNGATLYCKMTPCHVCAMLIINAGIKRVVAKKKYHKSEFTLKMFKQAGIKLIHIYNEIEKYNNQ